LTCAASPQKKYDKGEKLLLALRSSVPFNRVAPLWRRAGSRISPESVGKGGNGDALVATPPLAERQRMAAASARRLRPPTLLALSGINLGSVHL
jgi:hypothetical protein